MSTDTIRAMLAASAAEGGWDHAAQVAVLVRYIAAEATLDPLVPERLQSFLDGEFDPPEEVEA